MAKLNGVQTVDMVNGEITKVAYEGGEYAKVDGTPNKGDIAEIDREWGNQVKGAFYPVIQEEHRWYTLAPEIVFIDGETCHASNNRSSVNLFRKVEASPVSPPFAEMITAKVEAVEKRVDALEAKNAEPSPDTPTYRKVKGRKPRAGDYVKFGVAPHSWLTADKYYEITEIDCGDPIIIDDDADEYGTYGDIYEVYEKVGEETLTEGDRVRVAGLSLFGADHYGEVGTFEHINSDGECSVRFDGGIGRLYKREQLTKIISEVEQPKPKTGDIVVITANTNSSRNKVGDIGKVGGEKSPSGRPEVFVPGGSTRGIYTKYSEMRLATPAEIEQYERAVAKAEFKAGDYAKVIEKYCEHNVGDILKITEIITSGHDFKVDRIGENDYGYINVKSIEKVSAEEAESITKWAEIGRKPNEYKAGDIVTYDSLTHGCKIANEVIRINNGFIYYYTPGYGVNHVKMTSKRVELIAPVESRVDVK